VAFRSHYGFDAFYCQPGHEGSHEKGGVEGEGGRYRRNHCVPVPAVGSVDELNALLGAWDDADDRRPIGNRASSVGHDWAFERPLLRPLPAEPFDTALTLTPRVDRYAQVTVHGRLVGGQVVADHVDGQAGLALPVDGWRGRRYRCVPAAAQL
jgi:hypothetical protein